MILRRIDGNAVHPRIESTFCAELAERPIGFDKSLLGNILHLGMILHVASDQTQNLVLIFFHQQIECSGIAFLCTLHQLLVGFPVTHSCPPRRGHAPKRDDGERYHSIVCLHVFNPDPIDRYKSLDAIYPWATPPFLPRSYFFIHSLL